MQEKKNNGFDTDEISELDMDILCTKLDGRNPEPLTDEEMSFLAMYLYFDEHPFDDILEFGDILKGAKF